MKECIKCHKVKPLTEFYTHSEMGDGHLNKCKVCCRLYAKLNPNAKANDLKRHRYNPDRFLKHKYSMIKRRCQNPDTHHSSYKGLEVLSKEEWEEWCKETYPTFLSLYLAWQDMGFQRKYAPSIDRIDNSKGYIKGNMQWLTQSANSRKH